MLTTLFKKIPGGRLQVCHVDRLLRYEGEPPQVWVKYDKENAEVASVPAIPENPTESRQDQVPGPELVENEDPSTSILRRRSHKKNKTTSCPRQHNQPKTKTENKSESEETKRYRTKNQKVHQTGRVSNFHRNADNRPIT